MAIRYREDLTKMMPQFHLIWSWILSTETVSQQQSHCSQNSILTIRLVLFISSGIEVLANIVDDQYFMVKSCPLLSTHTNIVWVRTTLNQECWRFENVWLDSKRSLYTFQMLLLVLCQWRPVRGNYWYEKLQVKRWVVLVEKYKIHGVSELII